MDGTIYLRGARVDNLKLKDYYNTLEDKETRNPDGEVTIFQPQETGNGYYASVGWREPDAAQHRPLCGMDLVQLGHQQAWRGFGSIIAQEAHDGLKESGLSVTPVPMEDRKDVLRRVTSQ